MTRRSPSVARAAAMRADISVSERPRYFSGKAWRSERCCFSYSVSSGMIELIVGRPFVKFFAKSAREKAQTHQRAIAQGGLDLALIITGSLQEQRFDGSGWRFEVRGSTA